MENLKKTMPMSVCLAGYLDVLPFPPKLINADFKAGLLICVTYKKSKYPITFKFVFITNGAQLSAKECWFLPHLGQHLTSQH